MHTKVYLKLCLNTTRAYTVKHSHGQGVLSVGRVQTPVLALIVGRDQEIRNFKPENYGELWTSYRAVKFKHKTERFKEEAEAQSILNKIMNQDLTITDITEKKTVLYETDDLDAVFSNWNKTVTVSYEDVDNDLKLEAKKYIKWQLVNRLDIGVIKYKLTTDGLFRVYKNKKLKVMNSKGKVVV